MEIVSMTCPNCMGPIKSIGNGFGQCEYCGSKFKLAKDEDDVVGAEPAPLEYQCSQCGWNPPDSQNPPKFCPECGHRFDDGDIKK